MPLLSHAVHGCYTYWRVAKKLLILVLVDALPRLFFCLQPLPPRSAFASFSSIASLLLTWLHVQGLGWFTNLKYLVGMSLSWQIILVPWDFIIHREPSIPNNVIVGHYHKADFCGKGMVKIDSWIIFWGHENVPCIPLCPGASFRRIWCRVILRGRSTHRVCSNMYDRWFSQVLWSACQSWLLTALISALGRCHRGQLVRPRWNWV